MTPALNLPDWVDSFFAVALIIGFPIAVLIAWAFEMTPEGVMRTEAVADGDSIAGQTGRKLDFAILFGLVLVAALVIGNRFMPQKTVAPDVTVEETVDEGVEDASIAVLPFADLSPAGDQEYFSDGIAEEILNVLVRVDGMKVASRTSAFGFKGQEALGIPTIAERLKVRHVLEGSVRKSGKTLRITAQLIDASNDKHLWSQTYDRTLSAENIFAIQDEIANEIVRQLGIVMDGGEDGEAGTPIVSVKADTQNLNAYELFLQAHSKFLTRNDLKGTMALFEQAVEADPEFARAWAGLAAVYSVAPSWSIDDKDYFDLAVKSSQKAITLNPTLSMPHAVLGNVESNKIPNDFITMFAHLDEAIKLDPKETTAYLWRGIAYNSVGYFGKAEQDFLRCLDIDPAYEMCRRHMAVTNLYSGDTKRALELFEQGRLKGNRAQDAVFMPAYAATGNASAVLAYVYRSNSSANAAHLIELDYRSFMEPDFDFEKERTNIEAAYARLGVDTLDWTSRNSQFTAFQYRNYEAIKETNSYQPFYWEPYPETLKKSMHQKRWIIEAGLPEFWRENGFPAQCRPIGDDDFECE